MQVLSRNPQKGLDWSFLHKMDAELLADVVDNRQHTIPWRAPWRNHTRTIRCWHPKCIGRVHKATPEVEFKSRPRSHETRSTFFLFRENPNIALETQDWRLWNESWTTLHVEIIRSLYWFQITFFARLGLKVSSHKFTQFLPRKPLFDSRNASHQIWSSWSTQEVLHCKSLISDYREIYGQINACAAWGTKNRLKQETCGVVAEYSIKNFR